MHQIKDARQPGWFWVYNTVIDDYGPEIGPTGIAVYAALCRFASAERTCFPSLATLGGRLGISANTVRVALQRLVDAQLIKIEHRKDAEAGHQSNLYTLQNLKELPQNLNKGTSESEVPLPQNLSTKDDSLEQDSMKDDSPKGERRVQPHIAIIDAWTAALPGGSPITSSVYKRYARPASALHKAGIKPAQVAEFTKHLATQPFWQGKLIGLDYIAGNIRAYLAQKGPQPNDRSTVQPSFNPPKVRRPPPPRG